MVEEAWWAADGAELLARLGSGDRALSSEEASRWSVGAGRAAPRNAALRLFVAQFTNPLVLILIVGAGLSLVLREWIDAAIILLIVAGSGILGFTQEYPATQAIAELRSRLVRQVRLLRDGRDLMTFAVLRLVVHADPATFRTGWFVPSLPTELAALLVLRTRRRFWRSRPSRLLLWSSVLVAVLALCFSYSGAIAALFSFRPLAPGLIGLLLALVIVYAFGTEAAKRRHHQQGN